MEWSVAAVDSVTCGVVLRKFQATLLLYLLLDRVMHSCDNRGVVRRSVL